MAEQWKKKTLAHWDLINRLAVRRFGAAALAEEAALFVIDSLAADSWKRVKSYTGKGSYKSFLASISWRLLEDFSRRRFGRVRPPLWIRKLGGIWSLLFFLLCLQRFSVSDAVESISCHNSALAQENIEEAAFTLLGRIPQCGKQQGLELPFEEGDGEGKSGSHPEQLLEKEEQKNLFAVLFGQVTGVDADFQVPERFASLLKEGLELAPEERLLLKLIYQDNVGVTRAGVLLALNRDQVNGRLRRLLARLRKDFQRMGLDEELLELLR